MAIVLATDNGGPSPITYVVAISHAKSFASRVAIEVPSKLKRHLGLGAEPSWIYLDEVNIFTWPGPDIRDASRLSQHPSTKETCVIGALPTDWFDMIKRKFYETAQAQRLRVMKREE